jgi:[acyl-carrier-protein] S-malonyltransferase
VADRAEAILCPGQGYQNPRMREIVERHAPDLLQAACAIVGSDPFERLEDGTAYVQPAVYCATVAGWRAARDQYSPRAFAGHSLGELSALACAGALDPLTGVELVATRGRVTGEAARASQGSMMAVRQSREEVEPVLEGSPVVLATDNSREQVVLSGPKPVIREMLRDYRDREIKATRLVIEGAFHSPAMEPAAEAFARALEGVEFAAPEAPVYSCVTAAPFGDDVRELLVQSLTQPVRWRQVLEALDAAGIERFVEIGPGAALTGLVMVNLPGAEAVALDTEE